MEEHRVESSLPDSNEIAAQQSNSGKPITIVLAQDRNEVGRHLRLLLQVEPGFKVVGEVNNGFDALDMVGSLCPDILILGLNASNLVEIVRLVNQRNPNTVIIISRRNDNERYIQELIKTRLKVCILKSTSATKFIKAIRELDLSKNHTDKPLSKQTARNIAWNGEKVTIDPHEILTAREREVLDLVISGLTNVKIAARLSISPRTVEIHRANMLRKLGLLNQLQQLNKYAIERQILPSTDHEK